MVDGKKIILYVDDDRDLLDTIKIILESGGYEIRTADSKVAGVAAYRAAKPDLVIVDLMMEEVDSGLHFMEEIRADGPTPPTYLLSSVGTGMIENIDATQLGFTSVLQKPVDPGVLLQLVRARL